MTHTSRRLAERSRGDRGDMTIEAVILTLIILAATIWVGGYLYSRLTAPNGHAAAAATRGWFTILAWVVGPILALEFAAYTVVGVALLVGRLRQRHVMWDGGYPDDA